MMTSRKPHSSTRFFSAIALTLCAFILSAGVATAQNLFTSVSPIGQSSVNAGNNITFDFDVQNIGIFPAINVVLNVTLPTGIEHVADNGSCSTANPAVISCPLGNLGAFGEATRNITLHVADNFVVPSGGGFVNFSATSTANGNPPANTVVGNTPVTELADLQVSNVASTTHVLAGQQFEYTIFVDNFGPSSARNTTITDTLIALDKVTVNSCTFSTSQGGGMITQFNCTTGELVAGVLGQDFATFSTNFLRALDVDPMGGVMGRLRAGFILTALEDMTLTTDVRTFSDTPDPDPSNNQMISDVVTVEGVADLALAVDAEGELQPDGSTVLPFDIMSGTPFPDAGFNVSSIAVTAGRRLHFTYMVTNQGVSDADSAEIGATLPAGVTVVPGTLVITYGDDSAAPGSCQFGTPGEFADQMTCGLGVIDADAISGPITGFNVRKISFDVVTDIDLSSGTVLVNNVWAASDTTDTDNSDNLGSSLMVVSPLTGVSDCSVGGPYTNVICGDGSATLDLNGFGFALPDTGTLDYLWTTTCPDAAFDDATSVTPQLSFTSANPDNSPVSCQVELSVQNAFASSNCSGVVNVIDCAADCNGLLAGPAELDRCGVCDGDGNSCLGCTDQDVSGDIFTMSTRAVTIRRATVLAARQIGDERVSRLTIRQAKRAFRDNLAAISKIPAQIRSCTNSTFCVQTNNVGILDEASAGLEKAFVGLQKAVKKARASGGRSNGKALLKKGASALSAAQAALVNVPLISSNCL